MHGVNWLRFFLAVFCGGFVTNLTDWLFMGDWVYKRYDKNPEIWRYPRGQGEVVAIAWASAFPFLNCAGFALICLRLHLASYGATLALVFAIWASVALAMLVTTSLFIKLSAPITVFFSAGWLVKLGVAAIAVVLFLG